MKSSSVWESWPVGKNSVTRSSPASSLVNRTYQAEHLQSLSSLTRKVFPVPDASTASVDMIADRIRHPHSHQLVTETLSHWIEVATPRKLAGSMVPNGAAVPEQSPNATAPLSGNWLVHSAWRRWRNLIPTLIASHSLPTSSFRTP